MRQNTNGQVLPSAPHYSYALGTIGKDEYNNETNSLNVNDDINEDHYNPYYPNYVDFS